MAVSRRAVCSAAALIAGACFIVLAALVMRHVAVVQRFDDATHATLRRYGLAHPAWLSVQHAITHLGDTVTIATVDAATALLCLWRGRRRAAVFVAVVGLGTWAVRIGARDLVGRARPPDPLWADAGLSFPSGHTTNSAAMMGLIIAVCWPLLRRYGHVALVVATIAVPLAVGLSRVAGGVHWATDAIGGLLLAGSLLTGVLAVFPPYRPALEVTA